MAFPAKFEKPSLKKHSRFLLSNARNPQSFK
jgi:hypothetical protein